MTRRKALKTIFVLYDKHGLERGMYRAKTDAKNDAWGPDFKTYTIRKYTLVPLKESEER